MVRNLVIRSPRKMAAKGTVQRLAVHANTDERPGGTILRAENTSTRTMTRRSNETDQRTGKSERGGGRSRPVKAVAANTMTAAPANRMAASQIEGMSRTAMESNGQLTPRTNTVTNNRRSAAGRLRIGGPLSAFVHIISHRPGLLMRGAD